jgi:membrane associated rhomboid family serine protease
MQGVVGEWLTLVYSHLPDGNRWILSLMLTRDTRKYINAASFTHMFVHMDYNHLLGNLSAAFTHGFQVYRKFGAQFLYCLFLSGGVVASLSQGEDMVKDVITKLNPQGLNTVSRGPLVDSLLSAVTAVVKPATNALKQVASTLGLEWQTYYCGSSGAVCALMGCSFVLDCQSLFRMSQQRWSRHHRTALLLQTMFSAWNLFTISSYIVGEVAAMQQVEGLSSSWLGWFAPQDRIHHAAHIQGFSFGAAVGLGSMLFFKSREV